VKVRHGQGKWLLRRVLDRYLPRALYERPKQGFNVPIGAWLMGPLHAWARELLDAPRIRRDGFLDAQWVETCWREHQSGQSDRARELWAMLMVQAWLDSTRESRPSATTETTKVGEVHAMQRSRDYVGHLLGHSGQPGYCRS
jgi:asparagine synthase (glutamine-hydrolysing)